MNTTVKTKQIKTLSDVGVDDKVICISPDWVDITQGGEYSVQRTGVDCFDIIDDAKDIRDIPEEFFKDWQVVVDDEQEQIPTNGTKPIKSAKDVKVGDKVVCTDKSWVDITVGKEYKVCNTHHRGFDIIDDAGDNIGVPEEYFKDWQVLVVECPTQPIKEFTPKQNLLFTHEQNIMNVWTILDDLDMVARSWDDMTDDERKGVIEGIGLLGNLKMVKLQKSFEELFKEVI